MNTWLTSFPHRKPREAQTKIIQFCLDAFKEKRFVIVEAGTGVGKSAVAMTIAMHMNKKEGWTTHFVTTQKILQDQYVKDFSKYGMISLKSASNYSCSFKPGQTCADSQKEIRIEPKGTKFWKSCVMNCHYKKDKTCFIESKFGVTNFPYLITEANLSKGIKQKDLIVIDEAHNIEAELSKFIEISVSSRFAKQFFKENFEFPKTKAKTYKWIKDIYLPKVKNRLKTMESHIEKFKISESTLNEFSKITGQMDLMRSHISKLSHFIEKYDDSTWLFEFEKNAGDSKGDRFYFKPIDVSSYAESLLFRLGAKVLCMSATILDHNAFQTSLGISKEESACIRVGSPFPIKNRPIIYAPVGYMSKAYIDKTLPNLIEAIKSIISEHKNEKGIIHTHSYYIANRIKNSIHDKRILTHNSNNRDTILKKHTKSKGYTVLVSPSMTEGVDLKDDTSRFQIICKVPYPYLGDKLVKKRMNRWQWWYPLQTAKTVVQATGRSVRSNDDYATTYILDSSWGNFYKNNISLFPQDFQKCIVQV